MRRPERPVEPERPEPETVTIGKLEWTLADNGRDIEGSAAQAYCEGLRSGWRLPTMQQLKRARRCTKSRQDLDWPEGVWSYEGEIFDMNEGWIKQRIPDFKGQRHVARALCVRPSPEG